MRRLCPAEIGYNALERARRSMGHTKERESAVAANCHRYGVKKFELWNPGMALGSKAEA